MSAATTAAGRVCWIDFDWDCSRASDGITREPGEFAAAAFRVATGPIMSPDYVRWHPRVLDYKVSRGDNPEPGRLICQVTLATPLPIWVGSPRRSWTSYLGRDWCEPDEDRHAALASLVLRWPLPVASLPQPRPPERPGVPNLHDAMASVSALVAAFNAAAGPVLAKLEGGEDR
jgi:hypothetical protein